MHSHEKRNGTVSVIDTLDHRFSSDFGRGCGWSGITGDGSSNYHQQQIKSTMLIISSSPAFLTGASSGWLLGCSGSPSSGFCVRCSPRRSTHFLWNVDSQCVLQVRMVTLNSCEPVVAQGDTDTAKFLATAATQAEHSRNQQSVCWLGWSSQISSLYVWRHFTRVTNPIVQ